MASLTIIPYIPIPAKPYCSSSNQDRAKDVFKCINDHDEELREDQRDERGAEQADQDVHGSRVDAVG